MSNETCILTTKDFTILEVMRDRCLGRDDPMARILKRKLESAVVMFGDDIPDSVATLNSRVTFYVDDREPDTRVISHDRINGPVGLFLPISTQRGLALLGLAEGQEFRLTGPEGVAERVTLGTVNYQPEAARRTKEAMERLSRPAARKPALRVIRGAFYDRPEPEAADRDDFDGPGPSAA